MSWCVKGSPDISTSIELVSFLYFLSDIKGNQFSSAFVCDNWNPEVISNPLGCTDVVMVVVRQKDCGWLKGVKVLDGLVGFVLCVRLDPQPIHLYWLLSKHLWWLPVARSDSEPRYDEDCHAMFRCPLSVLCKIVCRQVVLEQHCVNKYQ